MKCTRCGSEFDPDIHSDPSLPCFQCLVADDVTRWRALYPLRDEEPNPRQDLEELSALAFWASVTAVILVAIMVAWF